MPDLVFPPSGGFGAGFRRLDFGPVRHFFLSRVGPDKMQSTAYGKKKKKKGMVIAREHSS